MQRQMMTTAEVAAYLRLGERKVYDLVQQGGIPCSRITGKLLFPRSLVDAWVIRHVEGAAGLIAPPPVAAGSEDPLLLWALRESGSELAVLGGGSEDGLRRLVEGRCTLAGLHIVDSATGTYNVAAARAVAGLADLVLIAWAWREQGLLTVPGNPLRLTSLADVAARGARLVQRQEGAGAQTLLRHLLAAIRLRPEDLPPIGQRASTGAEVATTIADGGADCGLATAAAARRFRLGFVPLHRERFDLAMRRRDYFEPALQKLMALTRRPAFAAKAADLGGYDVGETGAVILNG
jgi:excisionase family DNA binding protein